MAHRPRAGSHGIAAESRPDRPGLDARSGAEDVPPRSSSVRPGGVAGELLFRQATWPATLLHPFLYVIDFKRALNFGEAHRKYLTRQELAPREDNQLVVMKSRDRFYPSPLIF
jgi:hypothetical protein